MNKSDSENWILKFDNFWFKITQPSRYMSSQYLLLGKEWNIA